MQERIKKLIDKYEKLQQACVFCKAFWRFVMIVGPAVLSGYLVTQYTDKVVMGLGVAIGLYALVNLISACYRAEAKKKGRR